MIDVARTAVSPECSHHSSPAALHWVALLVPGTSRASHQLGNAAAKGVPHGPWPEVGCVAHSRRPLAFSRKT